MKGELLGLNPLYFYKVPLGLSKECRQSLTGVVDALVDKESENFDSFGQTAWLGDINASGDFHEVPEMKPLLHRLPFALGEYFEAMGLNANKFQAYITRCWPAYQTVGQDIQIHRHMQSNISGVYYLDVPDHSGDFTFFFYDVQSEFIPGLYSTPEHLERGVLRNWSPMRATEVPIKMSADQLLLFPSKTLHRVSESKNTQSPRLSIAFDINITLKSSDKQETGMPPLNKWQGIDVLSKED